MEQPETETTHGAAHVVGSATIRPGGMERLELGLYKLDDEPEFRVACDPDVGAALVYTDSKLTDGEVYIPLYHFQNFSHQTCTVTVWWVGGGSNLRCSGRP